MGQKLGLLSWAIVICMISAGLVWAEEEPSVGISARQVSTVKPNFLPPSEILDFLGVHANGGLGIFEWQMPDGIHLVEIHHNDAANLVILTGEASDIEFVETLIRKADVAPHQIEIEVQIVEVVTSRAKDLGIDWQGALDTSVSRLSWAYREDEYDEHEKRVTDDSQLRTSREVERVGRAFTASATLNLADVLKILDESGAGTIRNAPRILTLNNRRATILDGERVTYVTRYSSYTNLFEADSMDAGLTLSVLPSLGESGYITLHINAEFTTLSGEISGSPIKRGQMLENTIIVRDGESVSLGGLTRTVEDTVRRRFPILGYMLPFLFSRERTIREEVESYIILTPRVVGFMTTE